MATRCNPVIYTTGRHGCWFKCHCGAEGEPRWRTAAGASIDWAAHVATTPTPPTTAPREDASDE